jgi:hypothetical protein
MKGDEDDMKRALFSMVLAGLGIALSGCGGAFDTPEAYDGNWSGTWKLGNDSAAGDVTMDLDHDGDKITGTVSLSGSLCVGSATLVGEVDASGLSGSFTNGIGTVSLEGSIDDTDALRGSFSVTGGLCAGSQGTFVMHHP